MTWLWRFWRRPATDSQLVWRQIAAEPDDAGLFYPDGRSRRARITRPGYDVPDRAKVNITPKHTATVLRMERRK